MSIKLMSAIFETEFRDLPTGETEDGREKMVRATSVKITMLALADHANDDGECWPGYTRLELKTGLSRQGIADTIKAIRYNGLAFISDEPSKKRTNLYTINLQCFPKLGDKEDNRLIVKPVDQSVQLTNDSQASLPTLVSAVDLNHHTTVIEPSTIVKIEKHANKTVDAMLEQERQAIGRVTYPKRESLPEPIRELMDGWVLATGMKPLSKDVFHWMSAMNDWMELGVLVGDIAPAYEAVKDKFAVLTPHSLTNTLRARKASHQKSNFESEYL